MPVLDLEPIRARRDALDTNSPPLYLSARNALNAHAPDDIAMLIEEVERLRLALNTVGTSIYVQGKGAKWEQIVLQFIREELGRV